MRVRDEPFNPTTIINDANRKTLHEGENILKRWEEYFKELLNPMGALDTGSHNSLPATQTMLSLPSWRAK